MSAYRSYGNRVIHDLSEIWDFAWLGADVDVENISIGSLELSERMPAPSAFDAFPKYAGKRGVAAYRTMVDVTPGTAGLLECGGFGMWNRIYVDGKPIAETAMPYSGVSFIVPRSEYRTREIVILSDNRFSKERVPLQEQYFDFYAYGGIFRQVTWHEVGDWWLDRVQITTIDLDKRVIGCRARIGGSGDWASNPVMCEVDGVPVEMVDSVTNANALKFNVVLKGASIWSPDTPNLHRLTFRLGDSAITERFGIRTISTADRRVMLNNKPVKLLGYCRHEAHPQFGPALSFQQLVQDIQLLRDQGCNFVRGAHYPQDQRFLDLCDESGILVFEESLGWQQDESHFADERYCSACEDQTRLMVRNSINHPAVIMWGFLNEGRSDLNESRPLYRRLSAAIREEDDSRLVTFASNHPKDEKNFDLADIICVNNYPGWYSRDQEDNRPLDEIVPALDSTRGHIHANSEHAAKPFIVSEIGAGAIYGWSDPYRSHWSEEYQAEYLGIVCSEVVRNEDIAGVALWQFCDARTYSSSRALFRPRAFNNKGVLNEYRKPKRAYEVVKSIFRDGVTRPDPRV